VDDRPAGIVRLEGEVAADRRHAPVNAPESEPACMLQGGLLALEDRGSLLFGHAGTVVGDREPNPITVASTSHRDLRLRTVVVFRGVVEQLLEDV